MQKKQFRDRENTKLAGTVYNIYLLCGYGRHQGHMHIGNCIKILYKYNYRNYRKPGAKITIFMDNSDAFSSKRQTGE